MSSSCGFHSGVGVKAKASVWLICVLCLMGMPGSACGQEQVVAMASFARNFPDTFHFGGHLTGSIVMTISEIGDCQLTTSQADPEKGTVPDVSKLDFHEPFLLEIAAQKDSTKSKVLVVQGFQGQAATRRISTYYFDRKVVAQSFATDLVNLVKACGGTTEVTTAVLSDILLSPP